MSLASNLFAPKSRYILDVSTSGVEKKLKKQKASKNLNWLKRVAGGALIATVLVLTGAAGFLTNTATAPSAHADDWVMQIVCANNTDQPYGYLGGSSSDMNQLMQAASIVGNPIVPIVQPAAGSPETAYEKYTPFLPMFDYWIGVSDGGSGTQTFTGTGGHADGTLAVPGVTEGTPIEVQNPTESPLFSHQAGDCIDIGKTWGSQFANFLFMGPKVLVAGSAELFGFAYTSSITDKASPLYGIGQAITQLIVGHNGSPGLKDVLYLPFLTPIVMIGAISLLYIGIVKRSSTQAFQGALWMVGAGIGGLLFINQPMLIPTVSDTVVNAVTNATTSAIISDPAADELCKLPGSTETTVIREVKCGMWYNAIYVPWVSGQYGESVTNGSARATAIFTNDPRGVLANAKITLGGKVIANDGSLASAKITWPLYQLDNETGGAFNQSEIAYAELSGQDTAGAWSTGGGKGTFTPNGVWAGDNSSSQIGEAFLASIAGLGTSLMTLVSSFLLISYQLTMILLVTLSPLFFLVGAAPGFGRRIAMRWVELIVGLVLKRVIVSLMLAVFIKFYSIIMSLDSINYLFQLVLIIAVTIVGLTQRAKISAIFTDTIDFGGDKRISMEGNGHGGRILAGLTGAAVGAIGAASGVGGGISASMVSSIIGGGAGNGEGNTAPTAPSGGGASPIVPDMPNGPSDGGGSAPSDDAGYSTAPTSPSGGGRVQPPVIDAKKLTSDLRKKAIRQGAMKGAEQGFIGGKVNGQMVYAASQIGFNTGDTKYDNAVAKLEAQGRTFRDQQMLELFGSQLQQTQASEAEVERRHQELVQAASSGKSGSDVSPELAKLMDEQRRTVNRIDRKVNDINKQFPPRPAGK
jgi:hypothetical protein